MKNALILHGILGHAGENWGQWIHDELIKKSYHVVMPNLPDADHPDRKQWLKSITAIMDELGPDTIVIAHSLSVTSMLDYLEIPGHIIKKLISVSGFYDDYGMELNSYFLAEKSIDFDKVNKNVGNASVLYGDDDPYVPQKSLRLLADSLHVDPIVIPRGGHLNADAGFGEFPKLLEAVLGT